MQKDESLFLSVLAFTCTYIYIYIYIFCSGTVFFAINLSGEYNLMPSYVGSSSELLNQGVVIGPQNLPNFKSKIFNYLE